MMRINRQTNKQTDGDEHTTHVDRDPCRPTRKRAES